MTHHPSEHCKVKRCPIIACERWYSPIAPNRHTVTCYQSAYVYLWRYFLEHSTTFPVCCCSWVNSFAGIKFRISRYWQKSMKLMRKKLKIYCLCSVFSWVHVKGIKKWSHSVLYIVLDLDVEVVVYHTGLGAVGPNWWGFLYFKPERPLKQMIELVKHIFAQGEYTPNYRLLRDCNRYLCLRVYSAPRLNGLFRAASMGATFF